MKKSMTQAEHKKYNSTHYPGTRQLCTVCNQPTDHCEEDMLYMDSTPDDPLCENCYDQLKGMISDGYHTFHELYTYRRCYNALLFNEWALQGKYDVHKSLKHSDGTMFEGGYFIVVAQLPTGQISNHYELKHWDEFRIPEREYAAPWDQHTSEDSLSRMELMLKG